MNTIQPATGYKICPRCGHPRPQAAFEVQPCPYRRRAREWSQCDVCREYGKQIMRQHAARTGWARRKAWRA